MKSSIGFVTCQDLGPYFPSSKNPLYTHDDQAAVDYLEEKGISISPVVWGTAPKDLKKRGFSLLIVRSTWDYMDSEEKRTNFLAWLRECHNESLNVLNPVPLMLWNMDKRYLLDLKNENIATVNTTLIPSDQDLNLMKIFEERGPFVVKPTISAAAVDTFRVLSAEDAKSISQGTSPDETRPFEKIRKGRNMLIQPYHKEIETEGEWSLIFLNGNYSHSVLKKPKKGGWLVQDERGGSVHCLKAPPIIEEKAKIAFSKIRDSFNNSLFFHSQEGKKQELKSTPLYARVDLIPTSLGPLVGELEMVEPELFFLFRDGKSLSPQKDALDRFYEGILKFTKNKVTT
ncbi:MAG: hypothetical protein VXY34_09595 [Bdellovibrionota bacterium]|nr:hypothetical protein [Bdellovibrionota bacterium]